MRIYDPLYLSTVSSSSATRRIPSAMGLYRIEGGCLYRIKIGRYRSLSRVALSVHQQPQHQHQRHTGSSSSRSSSNNNNSTSNSDRALGPLTLHEFRDAPLPFPSPLQPFLPSPFAASCSHSVVPSLSRSILL